MKGTFEVLFIVYFAIEIYILRQLYLKKNHINFKQVKNNFITAIILLLIIYFFKIDIPFLILIFCIIALLISSYFGYFRDYFNRPKHFDRYLHGYGTFTFSLLFYFFIINFVQSGGSNAFRALFILFLGIAIGAIYEIIEFHTDSKQKNLITGRSAMQKGLRDTDFDLIFNFMGSICGALFAYFFYF